MILTGKSKEDFEKWLNSDEDILQGLDLFQLNNTCINALIIEWFDSVGITIDRNSYDKEITITNWIDGLEERTFIDCTFLEPFNEWWDKAIEKANKIYNNQNK